MIFNIFLCFICNVIHYGAILSVKLLLAVVWQHMQRMTGSKRFERGRNVQNVACGVKKNPKGLTNTHTT